MTRSRWLLLLGLTSVAAFAAVPACGGATEGDPPLANETGVDDAGTGETTTNDDGGITVDLGTMCPPGSPCGASGVCSTAGACCEPAASVCGAVCCAGAQICYAGACVTPGKACRSTDDCAATETCDPSLGGGDAGAPPSCGDAAPSAIGRCVPRPPVCPDGDAGTDAGACTEKCEYRPPAGTFDPITEWSWPFADTPALTHNQIMSAAVVGPLTDDNCDGKYDGRDVPAIVFNTFTGNAYGSNGILRAVTGKGKRLWDATDAAARTVAGASIAIGELDPASPGPEIATCSTDQKLMVFSADGKVLWKSTDPKIVCNYGGPQLGDIDGDGTPELLVRYTVIDAKTHGVIFQGRTSTFPYPTADYSTFADVDMDGDLDVVGGNVVYRNDGGGKFSTLWDGSKFATAMADGYVAIADLDLNGEPDLVVVSSLEQTLHSIRAVRAKDGSNLWGPSDTNLGGETLHGGGPPTIADFDGDGKPDVAMAGGYSYNVYEGATGKLKWNKTTTDTSSRVTGSSVFDFDGDGKAEVVYADERNLHIYEGPTGKELLTLCNPSGTLWEYPLVADVDGDDQAEIVLVSNDYAFGCGAGGAAGTGPTGLRVIGSKSGAWVRTRRIWNQHTYHVTNINDDATCPTKEEINWKNPKLNNFRQNVQPRGMFDAPNAIVEVDGSCSTPATLRAVVRNVGIATLPAGVVVGFYEGDPSGTSTRIGTAKTLGAILPGGSETLELKWDPTPTGYFVGTVGVFAKVADEGTAESVHQCKTSDDTSKVFKNKCTG